MKGISCMDEAELRVMKGRIEGEMRYLSNLYYGIGGKLSLTKSQLKEIQRRLDELDDEVTA